MSPRLTNISTMSATEDFAFSSITPRMLNGLRYSSNVCISGLTASGKTTHSHLLAGELGLTYVSGSQIQLNFMGVSPIQPKDFWITNEAKRFRNAKEFSRIDAELLRLEGQAKGYIFDTSTIDR